MNKLNTAIEFYKHYQTIILEVIFVLLLYIFVFRGDGSMDKRFTKYEDQKELQNLKIDSLKQNIDSLNLEVRLSNLVIVQLLNKSDYYENEIKNVNSQLKNLNIKYEKANNYANNYNSDSIRRYFSTFGK